MTQPRDAETNDRTRAVHFQEDGVARATEAPPRKNGVWSRLRSTFSRKAPSNAVARSDPRGTTSQSEEASGLRPQDIGSRIPAGRLALAEKFTTFDDLWSRIPDSSDSNGSDGHQLTRDWSGRLKEGDWVGGGGFGDVYKGIWEHLPGIDPTSVPVVVVKVIQRRALRKHEKRSVKMFNREIKICLGLQHPNIVSFIGVVFGFGDSQKSELPALVSLWMPNGTVKEYLENRIQPSLVYMFLDIAKGIEYLHTFNPQIVHGDIKAENILVDHFGRMRVTDFGLSRIIVDQADWATTAVQAPGTDRWMAPELLDGTQITVTRESDIYALGLTFLEMITLEPPFSQYKISAAVIAAVLLRKETPRRPAQVGDPSWNLLVSAWAFKAMERPNITQVVAYLESDLHLFSSYTNFIPDPQYFDEGWTDWTGYLDLRVDPIGSGAHGDIYLGKWTNMAIERRIDARAVVIKRPRRRPGPAGREYLKGIRREVDVCSRLRHKNIVSFLGIVYLQLDMPSLVFEFAENGTLVKYFQDNPTANRYSYISDLAKTVEYIHSLNPQIIHGDLGGSNILVKGDGTLLLGDFGNSQVIEGGSLWETSASLATGSVRWMAPELLRGEVVHSTADADIYAFGMTEIFTGRIPFSHIRTDRRVLVAVAEGQERPERPDGMPDWLWSIACLCWAENPDTRPRMSEVVQMFEAALVEPGGVE